MHDHPPHPSSGLLSWLLHLLGVVMLAVQNYGMTFLGLVPIGYGLYLQWKRDQREKRESEVRIAVMLGRSEAPG